MAVTYGVGHRSEAPGVEGLAHLAEHLMFEGSPNYCRGEHMFQIQAHGGVCNAYTGRDYTQYFEIFPTDVIELVCDLEADRMRQVEVTAEGIHRQLDVISAEVAETIAHRPYGGFPDLHIAKAIFERYENAHSGFVDNPALRDTSLEAVLEFFRKWYTPSNAVVSVVGAVDPERLFAAAERTFGVVPISPPPLQPMLDEPLPTSKRSIEVDHPFAPHPAVSLGFRVPDPITDLDRYLAYQAVASALAGDPTLGIKARLRHGDATVGKVRAKLCDVDPLESRNPAVFRVEIYSSGSGYPNVEDLVFGSLHRLATDVLDEDKTQALRGRLTSAPAEKLDSAINRARIFGWLGLLHDKPNILWRLPGRYGALSPWLISNAAKSLSAQPVRSVTVHPTGR
jgi:zinc protease